jgi:hypothetical protein
VFLADSDKVEKTLDTPVFIGIFCGFWLWGSSKLEVAPGTSEWLVVAKWDYWRLW